jgi:hypothetical protein
MYLLTVILPLFLLSGLSFASDRMTLMPNSSKRLEVKRGAGNKAPLSIGVDNRGNLLGLTPNNSGGYIGADSQGKPLIVTPLRGNLGVDNHGNIWTITQGNIQ